MDSNSSSMAPSMASEICTQIQSIFTTPTNSHSSPLEVLVYSISSLSPSSRIFLHGVGREGLMLRGFCMRLYHLGLHSHIIGDVNTPPISSSDLLICSAGPGGFSTVDAIARIAKSCAARVVLITAQPESRSEVRRLADEVVYLPAQTMADQEEVQKDEVRLPMGSLYEGGLFVLFEMVVMRMMEMLGVSASELRDRHTNLE